MENNNLTQAPMTPNVAPPPQPAAPRVQMPVSSNEQSSSSGNKIILWFVIGLVVIVLVVGGIYFFLSKQQTAPIQAPVTQVSPSPAKQQNLESDLNSINVDANGVNSDFTTVDQDLQQL